MKDPALLWYFNDWTGGTVTLSRHLKGCYIDLLSAQFNNGKLSIDEIKTVLGSDFGSSWPALQKKFKFEDSLYFNERLQQEKDKRINFTASRRSNAKAYAPATAEHMENTNININTELPIWLNKDAWKAWLTYNSEKKKKMTPSTIKLQLRKLEKYKEDHVAMIKQSIENNWQGLFPFKENFKKQEPRQYIELNTSSEENDRRRDLAKQTQTLTTKYKIK